MTEAHEKFCCALSDHILIGGVLSKAKTTETLLVRNPATMEQIGSIASCAAQDVDGAVVAAQSAFKTWKNCKAQQRGGLITACGQIIKEYSKELAAIMSYETGKAIRTESMIELGI